MTAPPVIPENNEDEIPDWLKRIRERSQVEPDAKSTYETPLELPSEEELPDWLTELKSEKIDKENPPPIEEEEQGDWLERLRISPVYVRDTSEAEKPTEPVDEPDGNKNTLPGIDMAPEDQGEPGPEGNDRNKPAGKFVFQHSEEVNPDDATMPVSLSEDRPNPFASEPEPIQRDRETEDAAFFESLIGKDVQADQEPLPFIPEPYEKKIAGSKGGEIPGFFQASALTNRVQLTEKQQLNVNLLKEMIANESEPRPIDLSNGKKPARFTRQIFLLAAALILLIVLIIAPYPAAMPQLYPVEVAALFNDVSSLPEESPVLVAVDYDPALAGEMQLASGGLIGHLMARDARMTLISTRTVGPMLAQSLVQAALPGQPRFSPDDHIVNLGYIPGDAAGLRSFVRHPRSFAAYTADLKLGWDSPSLQGINALEDFAAVVVITDSAEVIRNWIEQVQPSLGETPMFVVLSAQAGPLIQPYFDSRQVQGGLSGLSGGAMYSQILGRTGFANPYMNALQIGAMLAVFAILGGGLVNLISSVMKARSSSEGGLE